MALLCWVHSAHAASRSVLLAKAKLGAGFPAALAQQLASAVKSAISKADAALVEGDFFAEPEPRVAFAKPAAIHAIAKRSFESERLERWFGG